jgi:hypothetical protein
MTAAFGQNEHEKSDSFISILDFRRKIEWTTGTRTAFKSHETADVGGGW